MCRSDNNYPDGCFAVDRDDSPRNGNAYADSIPFGDGETRFDGDHDRDPAPHF